METLEWLLTCVVWVLSTIHGRGGGRYWVKTPLQPRPTPTSHIHHSTSYGEVLATLCAFEWHLACVLLAHISHLKRTFPSCVFSSNLILRSSYHTLCTLEGLLILLVCSLMYFQETLCGIVHNTLSTCRPPIMILSVF